MTSSDLSELIERVRPRLRRPKLKWSVQHATHKPEPGAGFRHFAFTPHGTFEIYEDLQSNFLLHFPKRMRRPAELFRDLLSAKMHAETALQSLKDKS